MKPPSQAEIVARASKAIKAWTTKRIIGIIDYYGAVHSRVAEVGEDHNKHFGWRMHKCWDFEDGKLYHAQIEEGDRDAILRHLKRKYGITE